VAELLFIQFYDDDIAQQARCSEPGDGAPVCIRGSVAPGHRSGTLGAMKSLSLFVSVMVVAITSLGQTNIPPTLYIHIGFGRGTNAEQFLCAPIHIGETIVVTNDDSFHLTGTIEQQGTNFVANRLMWWKNGDRRLWGFRRQLTLDKPVFAGGIDTFPKQSWVCVSTNPDDKPALEKLKEIERERQRKEGSQ